MRKYFIAFLMFFSAFTYADTNKNCTKNNTFLIGAGIYDITGPAAEQRMMGYAMLHQYTEGLYSRLWSRAFVIESPCNGKRVVFVNVDLGHVFQGVKQHVIAKLQEKYGNLYSDQNVLMTATHQHSGPGGYSTYTLYNLTTLGFNRDNFNAIVDGVVTSIERAEANMEPGEIKIAKGNLPGVTFNRSPQSYELNSKEERALYPSNVDTQMTVLRFDSLAGKPIGMLNWFPVHGVSMNNKNHYINGDNKGYAAYLFERDFQTDFGPHAFVAAFAQANAGDVSPNEYGHEGGQGLDGLNAVARAGMPQYKMAKNLYTNATELVEGGIDYRHTFVEMDHVNINAEYADGQPRQTCRAAIGVSMLAGTSDGEGLGSQGVTCNQLHNIFSSFMCELATTSCQGVKPIALTTGRMKPHQWTPNILPLQIVRVGNLFIAASPFELTTMSGRRIKKTITELLPKENQSHVVISSLANAYVQYLATPEEYQLQRYEGASTLFGPWTLGASLQTYAMLTKALIANESVAPGPMPLDLSKILINLQPGVVFDDTPRGKHFGDVYQDAKPEYKTDDTVEVVFWGGHPKNNFRIQDTFLKVQRMEHGEWVTIRQDRDWDTEYRWKRSGIANSLITIVWRLSGQDILPGYYRIVHAGDAKSFWTQKITAYEGVSSVFLIS